MTQLDDIELKATYFTVKCAHAAHPGKHNTALLSALEELMRHRAPSAPREWRGIESAPRQFGNGHIKPKFIVLLFDGGRRKDERITQGFWNDILKCWESIDDNISTSDFDPTHWMPLPEPPQ